MMRRLALALVVLGIVGLGGAGVLAPWSCAADDPKAWCHAQDIPVPAAVLKKDGEHKLLTITVPNKGTLEWKGVVAKGEITSAYPVFKGKPLKAFDGPIPKDVEACVRSKGLPRSASLGWLQWTRDFLVPDAEARWCPRPRSYTNCSGGLVCTTCVFSGSSRCGCYRF